MRPKAGAFSRYRPRILTLIVLIVVAVPTVLANYSPNDFSSGGGYSLPDVEYGWPLIWYWRNLAIKAGDTRGTWHVIRYGWPRLAGNLAIWSVMLALAGGTCEWLLRRYRPRFRWSLRTMLAMVVVIAVFCACCAALRDRAAVQDSLITAIEANGRRYSGGTIYGHVYFQRWGPKWLDLVGADRFRRPIVGVLLRHDEDIDELLKRIGRLPDLRDLDLNLPKWTPGMAAALGDMRQLRTLRIEKLDSSVRDVDEHLSDEVLTAIGKLNQLKVLSLSGIMFTGDSLRHLAALPGLKSLRLKIPWHLEDEPELEHLASLGKLPTLAHLLALPRLEAIGFHQGLVRVNDLRELSTLPRLKAIDLSDAFVTKAAIAELAYLESLEELVIDDEVASAGGLESLLALKRLKVLHIVSERIYGSLTPSFTPLPLDKNGQMFVQESDLDRCRQALEALRQSNPGIVIDSDRTSFDASRIWSDELRHDAYDRERWPRG